MKSLYAIPCLIILIACNSPEIAQTKEAGRKIDSLIGINRINEKTILVNFGNDAVTAINTQKGIVVIDAGISTSLTAKYRKIIEGEFHSNNFGYVINTHGHHDHNRGNSVFPGSKIVAQKNSLEEINDQWKEPDRIKLSIKKIIDKYDQDLRTLKPNSAEWNRVFIQKFRYLNSYIDVVNHIKIKRPDITFSDSLNIDMDDVTLEMIYFGNCHSKSDLIIYVPELKMLFTGDLFFKYGRAGLDESLRIDKDKWDQGVAWMERRINNIEIIVGGHGQFLSIDDLKSFNNIIRKIISTGENL